MLGETKEKLIIGADHAGYDLKEKLKKVLEQNEIPFDDLSPDFNKEDDYPKIAFKVAEKVGRTKGKGILVCGSGVGMSICANKIKGVRASLCHTEKIARLSRQHNDSNLLCLAGREVSEEENMKILKAWLTTRFLEGRHARRVNLIKDYEAGK